MSRDGFVEAMPCGTTETAILSGEKSVTVYLVVAVVNDEDVVITEPAKGVSGLDIESGTELSFAGSVVAEARGWARNPNADFESDKGEGAAPAKPRKLANTEVGAGDVDG